MVECENADCGLVLCRPWADHKSVIDHWNKRSLHFQEVKLAELEAKNAALEAENLKAALADEMAGLFKAIRAECCHGDDYTFTDRVDDLLEAYDRLHEKEKGKGTPC